MGTSFSHGRKKTSFWKWWSKLSHFLFCSHESNDDVPENQIAASSSNNTQLCRVTAKGRDGSIHGTVKIIIRPFWSLTVALPSFYNDNNNQAACMSPAAEAKAKAPAAAYSLLFSPRKNRKREQLLRRCVVALLTLRHFSLLFSLPAISSFFPFLLRLLLLFFEKAVSGPGNARQSFQKAGEQTRIIQYSLNDGERGLLFPRPSLLHFSHLLRTQKCEDKKVTLFC